MKLLIKPIAWIWNKVFAVKTNLWIMKNLNNRYCLWKHEDFKFKRIYIFGKPKTNPCK